MIPGPRIVVTGVGVISPNGIGLPAFREALQAGRSGIRRQEQLRKLNFAAQIGGIPDLDEEDVLKVIPESELHKLSEAMVYAVMASVECARSAGIPIDPKSNFQDGAADWNCGAIIGCGIGGMDTIFESMVPVLSEAYAA